MKPFRLVCITALLAVSLTGCSELFPKSGQNLNMQTTYPAVDSGELGSVLPEGWDETTEPEDLSQIESLTMTVTEKTIKQLEDYPNLKTLNLNDSTCYTAILVYIQNHPEVEVTYSVDFGGASAINWAEDIVLPSEGVNYSLIQKNLIYLPNLRSVHLPKTGLTLEQIDMLRRTYPEITFSYTVAYRDMELEEGITELNLAGITASDMEEAAAALTMLPNLTYVELMNASGTCANGKSGESRSEGNCAFGIKLGDNNRGSAVGDKTDNTGNKGLKEAFFCDEGGESFFADGVDAKLKREHYYKNENKGFYRMGKRAFQKTVAALGMAMGMFLLNHVKLLFRDVEKTETVNKDSRNNRKQKL